MQMFLLLIFLVFILGIMPLTLGVRLLRHALQRRGWKETGGTTLSAGIQEVRGKYTEYNVVVTYEYTTEEGERLEGSIISLRPGINMYSSPGSAATRAEDFKPGTPVRVWYDPKNPKDALLNREAALAPPVCVLLAAFGSLMLYLMGTMLLYQAGVLSQQKTMTMTGLKGLYDIQHGP